jgi:hypothetical protein
MRPDARPVLVGMNNPYGSDPRYALYPSPRNSAGWRLHALLKTHCVVSRAEYVRAFDRRNLLEQPWWDAGRAAELATEMEKRLRGHVVVLLGDQVRRAFRLPKQLILPIKREGVEYRQLPHPSGRNLFYNDPVCARLAGLMMAELYETTRGRD